MRKNGRRAGIADRFAPVTCVGGFEAVSVPVECRVPSDDEAAVLRPA
jgi:hypothetical protein